MDSFNILMHAPTKYSSPTPSYIIITTMVRFVSHKEHQELSMQSSPVQLPKHHQRSTLHLLTSSAVKQSQIHVMQISPPGRRVQTNAMQTTQLPRLYNLYNNYPRLLVADGQQERDQVPVNIWTQQTVRLTTYLMRMRTAVVIVKKNLQDQTLGVHFELLSTVMLSIDFPRRRLLSTPNEDDEDDCLF